MRRPTSTLVDEAESIVAQAAQAGREDVKYIHEFVGDRGFGKVKLTPDDKAMLQVPLWFVFGNAADTDEQGQPLALAYWRPIYADGGAKAVEKHDREMRQIIKHKSPEWLQYLTPEQVATLKDFIARGLHSGWLRPQAGQSDGAGIEPALRPVSRVAAPPGADQGTSQPSTPPVQGGY